MSSVPPLPMPPGGAPMGGQNVGGMINNPTLSPAGMAAGVTPYPVNPFTQLMGSAASFVDKLRQTRDQQQQYHLQKYEEGLKLLDQGIPMDYTKLAAHAKKAGIDMNTEGPNPAEIAFQQQQQTGAGQAQAASNPFVAGTPMGAKLNQDAEINQGAVPPAPTPPPGMLDRLKQMMGMSAGNVSPESPGVQALAMRGTGAQAAAGSDVALQQLKRQAITGDPRAMMAMSRFGLAHTFPTDEAMELGNTVGQKPEKTAASLLWMQTGGPVMQKMIHDISEKMAPNFLNAQGGPDVARARKYAAQTLMTGESDETPSMDKETRFKIDEDAYKLMENTDMPINVAHTAATVAFLRPQGGQQFLANVAKAYPQTAGMLAGSANTRDWMKFGQQGNEFMFSQQKFEREMRLHQDELNLSINKELATQYGSTYDRAYKMLTDPAFKGTPQEQESAVQMLANAVNQTNGLTVNVGGKQLHFGTGDLTTDRFFNVIGGSNYRFGRPSLVYKTSPLESALKAQYDTSSARTNGIFKGLIDTVKENNPGVSDKEAETIAESMMQQGQSWVKGIQLGQGVPTSAF